MITGRLDTAVVLGATGLVGRHLVDELARARVRVTTAGRRPPLPSTRSAGSPGFHALDFEALLADPGAAGDLFDGADAVFVALGSTRRAAGSREAFRRVDLGYVRAAARAARRAGVPHLLAVSSVGASPSASSFYLQVKGEAEEALQALDFPALTLARPSLLEGTRESPRLGERLSGVALRLLRPLLRGPFERYRPIHAGVVARALVRTALDPPTGTAILESHHLARRGA